MVMAKKNSPFETEEFKRLQKEWYAKAESKDFHNIEDPETGQLEGSKHNVSIDAVFSETEEVPFLDQLVRDQSPNVGATTAYYTQSEHFLNSNKHWHRSGDKEIWRMHSQGKSVREIAEAVQRPRQSVHDRIQAMEVQARLQRHEKKP
jgi:hypothetical protein